MSYLSAFTDQSKGVPTNGNEDYFAGRVLSLGFFGGSSVFCTGIFLNSVEDDSNGHRSVTRYAKHGLPVPITPRLPHNYASIMSWYTRTIDTVDISGHEETETDRMWRKIAPQVHHTVRRAGNG